MILPKRLTGTGHSAGTGLNAATSLNQAQEFNSADTDFEPLLNSHEAARLLCIHPKTLQQMARRGKIPAIRVGKYWRFRTSALDTWIKGAVNSDHGCAYRETQENDL